jgi:hypothetical protein
MAGSPRESCARSLSLKLVQHAVNLRDIRVLVVERAGKADRVTRVIALYNCCRPEKDDTAASKASRNSLTRVGASALAACAYFSTSATAGPLGSAYDGTATSPPAPISWMISQADKHLGKHHPHRPQWRLGAASALVGEKVDAITRMSSA